MTWANIALLRAAGSSLPIEVWHLSAEVTDAARHLLRWVGATPRLLRATGHREGYFNVPFALAETRLAEVLVLDSDLTPLSNPEDLLNASQYLEHGALLAPDLLDLRARDFYPGAWERLGLPAPQCPSPAVRCERARGTDSALMALNLRGRCAGAAGVLRALAADAAESQRYSWAGDKELYQIAWQAVGCPSAFLPYPSLLGQTARHLGFVGLAMAHHAPNGRMLGVHWAWSKPLLHHSVPDLPELVAPPIGGYASPTEHLLNHPDDVAVGISAVSGEVREHYYMLRYGACYTRTGDTAPCISTSADIDEKLREFSALLAFARWALHACEDGGLLGSGCRLRLRLPKGARGLAQHAFPWIFSRAEAPP